MLKIFKTFVLLSILPSLIYAQGMDIVIWKNSPDSAPIILPKKQSESKEQAVIRYFETVANNKPMQEILTRDNFVDFYPNNRIQYNTENVALLTDIKDKHKPFFILSTNSMENLFRSPPGYFDIVAIVEKVNSKGAQSFVLPPVHDLGLTKVEREDFAKKLTDISDGLFVLGGDDIDPYFYNQEITYSKNVNRRRDLSEIRFVRNYDKRKDKTLFGVCRGHQLCAIVKDQTLTQDILIERNAPKTHLSQDHEVFLPKNSFLREIFNKEVITVNSFHHQEVAPPTDLEKVELAAVSTDQQPITEALQYKTRPGFSLQFHPEIMNNEVGDRIIEEMVKLTNQVRLSKRTCTELIEDFFK